MSDPDPKHCDIESYASDVISLIDHLKLPPVVLAGHSMGCCVILQAFADAPEKIAGLVLVEGSRAGGTGNPENIDVLISERIREHGYANMIRSFFEGMFFEGSAPVLKEKLINRALTLPEETGSRLIRQTILWDDNRLCLTMLVRMSSQKTPAEGTPVRIKWWVICSGNLSTKLQDRMTAAFLIWGNPWTLRRMTAGSSSQEKP